MYFWNFSKTLKGTWRSYLILIFARRTCRIHKGGGRSSETHRSYPLSMDQMAKIESCFLIPFALQTPLFLLLKWMQIHIPAIKSWIWIFWFGSWAGTSCSEARASCSSPKDWVEEQVANLACKEQLSLHCWLKLPSKHVGVRENLSWLIPLSSVWTWEWGYSFQSLSELRSFEFVFLCAWKSGFYPMLHDMMLFEIEKINALQTSFA